MTIQHITDPGKSNFPHVVQVKNTENWNSVNAFPDDASHQALARAEGLARAYPALPIRIVRFTGGAYPT